MNSFRTNCPVSEETKEFWNEIKCTGVKLRVPTEQQNRNTGASLSYSIVWITESTTPQQRNATTAVSSTPAHGQESAQIQPEIVKQEVRQTLSRASLAQSVAQTSCIYCDEIVITPGIHHNPWTVYIFVILFIILTFSAASYFLKQF